MGALVAGGSHACSLLPVVTLAECATQRFGGTLEGRVTLTAGLGGMGGAQPLAATMNGAAFLGVELMRQGED